MLYQFTILPLSIFSFPIIDLLRYYRIFIFFVSIKILFSTRSPILDFDYIDMKVKYSISL